MKLSTRQSTLLVVGAALLLIAFINSSQPTPTSNVNATRSRSPAMDAVPSCKTDWHLCSDNSDLINNYKGDDLTHAPYECMSEANKFAKYGDPKWSWGYKFSLFYPGDDYVKTGILRIVDKEVQFQNGFGAWVHVRVECTYDLNLKKVNEVHASER